MWSQIGSQTLCRYPLGSIALSQKERRGSLQTILGIQVALRRALVLPWDVIPEQSQLEDDPPE